MATTSATRANPYVGPRSFTTGETLYGRDRETKKLLNLLIAERIVLLYSPSGAGKTSLVQAALVPRLIEEGFAVLPVIRVSAEPPPVSQPQAKPTADDMLLRMLLDGTSTLLGGNGHTLSAESKGLRTELSATTGHSVLSPQSSALNRYVLSVLLSLEEGLPAERQIPLEQLASMSLADYLGRRAAAIDAADGIVLLFDQFEEILTVDPTDQAAKQEFFAQLGEALRDRRLWALFAMREDYLAPLDPYLRHIPTRLGTTFRLDLLEEKAARQAMQQPSQLAGVTFADAAASALADDLRRVLVQRPDGTMEQQLGPYVEPVQLQVVCHRLWSQLPAGDAEIGVADVAAVGDVDSALTAYYVERAAATAAATEVSERAIRDWFDRQLITEQGIRGQVLQGAERSAGLDNRAIWPLIDAHLVRGEKRRGATWFELAHDRLIAPVRADNAAWREANLSLLQRQAALWDQQSRPEGLLLRDAELDEAEAWAAAHADALTEVELDFLENCRRVREVILRARRANRRIRRLAIVASVVGVIAVALMGVVAFAWQQAKQQARIALARQLAAQSGDNRERRPALALLAALESIRAEGDAGVPIPAAESALYNGLASMGGVALRGPAGTYIGQLQEATFGLKGRYIVTFGENHTVRLWDTSGPRVTQVFSDSSGFQISPSGRYLFVKQIDHSIQLWDLAHLDAAPRHLSDTGEIAFSPDESTIAVSQYDTPITRVWRLANLNASLAVLSDTEIVEFSPDGHYLATDSSYAGQNADDTVRLWRIDDLRVPTLVLESTGIIFSPDGRYFLVDSDTGVEVREIADPTTVVRVLNDLQLFQNNVQQVFEIGHSFDKRYMVLSGDGVPWLWDATDLGAAPRKLNTGNLPAVDHLQFSPYGPYLVGWNGSNASLLLWDLNQGLDPVVLRGHENGINGVAFSPNGGYLASSSFDTTVRLWSLADPLAPPRVLRGHESSVNTLAFNPEGSRLVTLSEDGIVRLWNLAQLTAIPTLGNLNSAIRQVKFSSNGRYLAIRSEGSKAQLVELANLDKPLRVLTDTASLNFKLSERYMVSFGNDSKARLWALPQLEAPLAVLSNTNSVEFSPDERFMASGWKVGAAMVGTHVWMLPERGAPLAVLSDTESVNFSPDGRYMASLKENKAQIWELSNLDTPLATLSGVESITFSPDGRHVAGSLYNQAGTEVAETRVWALPQMDVPLAVLSGVESITFSPDGRYLAGNRSGPEHIMDVWATPQFTTPTYVLTDVIQILFSPDMRHSVIFGSRLRVIDLEDPTAAPLELRRLSQAGDANQTIAAPTFSSDGRYFAVLWIPSNNGTYQGWDTETGETYVLSGHTSSINFMVLSPDGHTLATGSADGTVRLWNMANFNAPSIVLRGHVGSVLAIEFSPDGRYLASGGRDGTVRLWDMQLDKLKRMACAMAGRNATWDEWRQAIGGDYQKTCEELPVHRSLVDAAADQAQYGDVDGALVLAGRATALGKATDIPGSAWSRLCRQVSLAGRPNDVRDACEQAVALAPNDGEARDSRGLFRALTGDLKGASEDFKAFVAWGKVNYVSKERIAKREAWIAELEAGRNPFDPQTLKQLRDE